MYKAPVEIAMTWSGKIYLAMATVAVAGGPSANRKTKCVAFAGPERLGRPPGASSAARTGEWVCAADAGARGIRW
jgi:hypothetical protein